MGTLNIRCRIILRTQKGPIWIIYSFGELEKQGFSCLAMQLPEHFVEGKQLSD